MTRCPHVSAREPVARRWQVTAPVQWETIMQGLIDGGMETGYELGPGKVLAGIMKRVDKTKAIENIEV